jgi:phage shock protein C
MSDLMRNNGRPPQNGFRLDKQDGKLFGVCAGLANWSGVDALIWRLGFVGFTLLGFGLPILVYIAIALIAD